MHTSGTWGLDQAENSPYYIQGNWNASTNTPNLSTVTEPNLAWIVSVAGSTNLGGITSWLVGDIAIKTPTGWAKLPSSSVTPWGSISGTLSDQTDLQNALNLKANANAVVNLTTDQNIDGIKTFKAIQTIDTNGKTRSRILGTGGNQFGNYQEGNYSEFEEDGTLHFVGNASVYRDINLSGATLLTGGANNPDIINFIDGNLRVYAFDGVNITERLYGSCEMQHDYKEGTDIEVHIHWTPTNGNTGNVVWQVYYSWANKDETYPPATLLVSTPTAATGAWKNTYTSVGVISGAGKTINSQLSIQVFRDPGNVGDTYVNDVALLQLGIHYECDTTGSRSTLVK